MTDLNRRSLPVKLREWLALAPIPPPERAMMDALAYHTKYSEKQSDPLVVWPSVRTLAAMSMCSEPTARRTLKKLRNKKYIVSVGETDHGVVKYRLNLGHYHAPKIRLPFELGMSSVIPPPVIGDTTPLSSVIPPPIAGDTTPLSPVIGKQDVLEQDEYEQEEFEQGVGNFLEIEPAGVPASSIIEENPKSGKTKTEDPPVALDPPEEFAPHINNDYLVGGEPAAKIISDYWSQSVGSVKARVGAWHKLCRLANPQHLKADLPNYDLDALNRMFVVWGPRALIVCAAAARRPKPAPGAVWDHLGDHLWAVGQVMGDEYAQALWDAVVARDVAGKQFSDEEAA